MWFMAPEIERGRFGPPHHLLEISMSVLSFTERSVERAAMPFSESESSAGRGFVLQWLFDAAARFAEHMRRQRAMAELHALDDYHLKDIGIARCEIWYRVNHPQDRFQDR